MLNRSAIVVKPKQLFLDWLHTADPTSHRLTLGDLSREPTIYLIPACDTEADIQEVLSELCEEIFVLNQGDDNKYTLNCITNAQICYGASVAGNTTLYWGRGENGDQQCADCCYKCVNNPGQPISLTCP